MSVSGEQVSKVREGDIILESDGYIRLYMTNTSDVWFEYTVSPNGAAWVRDPKAKPFVPEHNKFVMNLKDLLIKLREEMREPSN
jgi:hypothetical protein